MYNSIMISSRMELIKKEYKGVSMDKCICCGVETSRTIINSGVELCYLCSHIVSNKIKENFYNNKQSDVFQIIKEINNWTDKDLFIQHKKIINDDN